MEAELVPIIPAKQDVMLRLSNQEAMDIIDFIGGTNLRLRRSICTKKYNDATIYKVFDVLKDIVDS